MLEHVLYGHVQAIRAGFSGSQLTICGRVSSEIERELGFVKVMGRFVSGSVYTKHAWNVIDGTIVDATADQFEGMERINITTVDDSRYVPFTQEELDFIARFTREEGKEPDDFDFAFMNEYEEEAAEAEAYYPMHSDDLEAMGWDVDENGAIVLD
jgi:hypothetical protein